MTYRHLTGGKIAQIIEIIANHRVVNIKWFTDEHPQFIAGILRDMGYSEERFTIDGKRYRVWVSGDCIFPRLELDVHLREHTWEPQS